MEVHQTSIKASCLVGLDSLILEESIPTILEVSSKSQKPEIFCKRMILSQEIRVDCDEASCEEVDGEFVVDGEDET